MKKKKKPRRNLRFLDFFGDLHRDFRGDAGLTVAEELLYEGGDVSASDRDVFDAGAHDVTVDNGQDMGHAVAGVDDCTRE